MLDRNIFGINKKLLITLNFSHRHNATSSARLKTTLYLKINKQFHDESHGPEDS